MPVRHAGVTERGEFRRAPAGLAINPALRIARADLRVVRAPLAREVRAGILAAAVRGRNLFSSGRRLDRRAIPRTCASYNRGLTRGWVKSLRMNLANPSPLCRRARFVVQGVGTHRIVRCKATKPAVQKMVIHLFDQWPLRPDAGEDLEQQPTKQRFRGHRDARRRLRAFPGGGLSSLSASRTSSRICRSGWFAGPRFKAEMLGK